MSSKEEFDIDNFGLERKTSERMKSEKCLNIDEFAFSEEEKLDSINNNKTEQKRGFIIKKSLEDGFTGKSESWFDNGIFFNDLYYNVNLEKKDSYFNSYSSFYIHEEMIKDKVRTGSYLKAIEKNKHIFKDKTVLDIGCGTGILSIFASKAGAKHVYGIEFADISNYAEKVVEVNKLSEKITIIKAKVEEADLPVEKVDIIISEWMGYFLLYESMLDTVLFARDKWLRQDGYMFPDKAELFIAGIVDGDFKSNKFNFWNNIYGINMSCFRPLVIKDPIIDYCDPSSIISSSCKVFEINLLKVKKEELDFSNEYEIEFLRKDKMHALISWFDIGFTSVPNKVFFSTSPFDTRTHWKQVLFWTNKDFLVEEGDKLSGSIAVRKSLEYFRGLDVKISFNLKKSFAGKDVEDNENSRMIQLYKIK